MVAMLAAEGIFPSRGTHSACQLSPINIRKTRKWATNTFHRVQQSTILVCMASRNILWIPVNTDEVTWMLVVIMFCHQVPMILLGPSRWTVISGWHHQHRATWLDEADNAWCFMIMEIFLKRVSVAITYLIFSAVHVSGVLMAIFVLVILWIVWKAKVVRSTTRVIVVFSSHYTWYKEKIINNYFLKSTCECFDSFCQFAKLMKRFLVLFFASAWNGGSVEGGEASFHCSIPGIRNFREHLFSFSFVINKL